MQLLHHAVNFRKEPDKWIRYNVIIIFEETQNNMKYISLEKSNKNQSDYKSFTVSY